MIACACQVRTMNDIRQKCWQKINDVSWWKEWIDFLTISFDNLENRLEIISAVQDDHGEYTCRGI